MYKILALASFSNNAQMKDKPLLYAKYLLLSKKCQKREKSWKKAKCDISKCPLPVSLAYCGDLFDPLNIVREGIQKPPSDCSDLGNSMAFINARVDFGKSHLFFSSKRTQKFQETALGFSESTHNLSGQTEFLLKDRIWKWLERGDLFGFWMRLFTWSQIGSGASNSPRARKRLKACKQRRMTADEPGAEGGVGGSLPAKKPAWFELISHLH